MNSHQRVCWSEGTFLRPQHFQQLQRFIDGLVRGATDHLISYGWGVHQLRLDTSMLGQGKVSISFANGIMPDGTPFEIPEFGVTVPPLMVDETIGPGIVYLALPVVQDGGIEFGRNGDGSMLTRYLSHEIEIPDAIVGAEAGVEPVEVGRFRFELLHENTDRNAYACLGICRVAGFAANGAILLDPDFIPPCLQIAASDYFRVCLNNLVTQLEAITKEKVPYVTGRSRHGVGDIEEFLVLQLANRALVQVSHMAASRHLHPHDLFYYLLGLVGEASTFIPPDHLPMEMPSYRHDDLSLCYLPLIREITRLMGELARPDPTTVRIPLEKHPAQGVYMADIKDRSLFKEAKFVLAVRAKLDPEVISKKFPDQVQIGPTEFLRKLVNTGQPGIALLHLTTVPPQIPYYRDMTYFELDRDCEHWRRLPNAAGMAMHIVDEDPELQLACWAVRESVRE